jgi:hypothetical protein
VHGENRHSHGPHHGKPQADARPRRTREEGGKSERHQTPVDHDEIPHLEDHEDFAARVKALVEGSPPAVSLENGSHVSAGGAPRPAALLDLGQELRHRVEPRVDRDGKSGEDLASKLVLPLLSMLPEYLKPVQAERAHERSEGGTHV